MRPPSTTGMKWVTSCQLPNVTNSQNRPGNLPRDSWLVGAKFRPGIAPVVPPCRQTASPQGLAVLFANRDIPVVHRNTVVVQAKPTIFSSPFICPSYSGKISKNSMFAIVGKLNNIK